MDDRFLYYTHLRARAAQCREMAKGAVSPGVACELEAIADEYDCDADLLEARLRPAGVRPHAG